MPHKHEFELYPRIPRSRVRILLRKAPRILALSLGILISVAGILTAIVLVPPLLIHPVGPISASDRLRAANDLRGTLVQVIGGLALLAGLYFTRRTMLISREGQLTERFSRAIDQLGDERLDVRLGGLYALARVMKDSSLDNSPVIQVLTTFIRTRRSLDSSTLQQSVEPDVQVALRILGERPRGHEEERRLQLADLSLVRARLEGTRFDAADFTRACLRNISFVECSLKDVSLLLCDLQDSFLRRADLTDAVLLRANLTGSYLAGANFKRADLREAKLQNADLAGYQGSEPANLVDANLTNAELKGTILCGVDLRKTKGLTQQQLDLAILDEKTKLPGSLHAPDKSGGRRSEKT